MVDLSRVRVSGALAPFSGGFVVALAGEGYTPAGAVKQLHLFAGLSRWLENEGLVPADLDREVIERFFSDRRAVGYTKLVSARAAEPLGRLSARDWGRAGRGRARAVRAGGAAAGELPPVSGARARRAGEVGTRLRNNVRPFLEGFVGPGGVELGGWTARRSSRLSSRRALRSRAAPRSARSTRCGRCCGSCTPRGTSIGRWRTRCPRSAVGALEPAKRLEPEQVRRCSPP